MIGGEAVELRAVARASDRYSRILAHAYYTLQDTRKSAAHELLAKGFARVSSEAGECCNSGKRKKGQRRTRRLK